MCALQTNLLILAITSLNFWNANSEAKFNYFSQCGCDQLLYESECKLFPHCEYTNSTCSYKSCNSLKIEKECEMNMKCAWYNNQCDDFKSCDGYGIQDSKQCHALNVLCQYNPYKKQCLRYNKAFTKSCLSTPPEECYLGSDGVCQLGVEGCERFPYCGYANYTDYECLLAYPACFPNPKTKECESKIGCSKAQTFSCKFAPDNMNSYNYYLCQEGNNGTCVDFNLTSQTIDTCFYDTMGYYHWTGTGCEVCYSPQILFLIASLMVLLIL